VDKSDKLCTNFDCEKKYQCKRYCTKSHEDYENIPNLKDECKKSNKYALFKHWK